MTKLTKLLYALAAVSVASVGVIDVAAADEAYPTRYVKLIIALPPGGPADVVDRAIAEKVGAQLGQSVVIENRPGGDTVVGTIVAARAKPDGYTIFNLTASGVAIEKLHGNLPYKLERDFVPVIGLGSFPMVLAVPAASNIKSFADLVAVAKSANGITYGSGGVGTLAHLAAARLLNAVKGSGTHVSYRGSAAALEAVMANEVQLFFATTGEAVPVARSGRVRLIGLTSKARFPGLPDVPTMTELGLPDFGPRVWQAIMAPAGTPSAVVSRLHDAFAAALVDPSVQERLKAVSFAVEASDPVQLSAFISAEGDRWGKVIKDNHIKVED